MCSSIPRSISKPCNCSVSRSLSLSLSTSCSSSNPRSISRSCNCITMPTSSPPAVEPPPPVLKPPAKRPKLRGYTYSSKPLPVNPPDKPQNGSNFPGINQEHRNYLIAAVAGCSIAGIAFLAVLIFCVKKKKKEIAPNDGRAKGWETASEFECRCLFAAIYHDGSSLNVKYASAVNDADPHKSSEADAELSKPEMNANAHAPVPLPPGKSAPPPPPPGPPPPPPPKPPLRAYLYLQKFALINHQNLVICQSLYLLEHISEDVLLRPGEVTHWVNLMLLKRNKNHSFETRLNEEMMDSLFGYIPGDQGNDDCIKVSSSFDQTSQYIQIIDPKKSQNLAILLKALNVTTEELYDALDEGKSLSPPMVAV
ncbi:hypothetical protein KY284_030904 [Solanum tuberosum]|nr:hypothetical protein KY284_030904 [Solanum tuberosum]